MEENKVLAEDLDFFVKHFSFSEKISGKTFLITGATGLIGSILIKCLLKLNEQQNTGVNIVAMVRNQVKAERLFGIAPIKWLYQDTTEPLDLPEQEIDYIIHLASPTNSKYFVDHPVETMRTIIEGTKNILEYAKSGKVRSVVYASSLESYGSVMDDIDIFEHHCGYIDSTDIRSCYSLSKRTAECICHCYSQEYAVPVKIARLTQVFGAGVSLEDNRVFAQFAKSIINKKDIVLHTTGESSKPYCYTIDAILAIFYLLIKGENGEAYNIANPETYISIHDMAQFLVDKFGNNTKLITELRSDRGYAPTTKLKLNTEKLELLGWKPYFSLKEMYTHLIAHYKATLL